MKELLIIKEKRGRITDPSSLFKKIKKIDIDYNQENFLIFFLNAKNKILGSEVLFKGGLSACYVDNKTIFRKALLISSDKIIIAHNHPSRELDPSQEDIITYERIKKAGDIIGLNVLDSIIFNEKEFYSILNDSRAEHLRGQTDD